MMMAAGALLLLGTVCVGAFWLAPRTLGDSLLAAAWLAAPPSPCWQATTDQGHPFTLRLPPSATVGRIFFTLLPGSRPVFTRLQVQDCLDSP